MRLEGLWMVNNQMFASRYVCISYRSEFKGIIDELSIVGYFMPLCSTTYTQKLIQFF